MHGPAGGAEALAVASVRLFQGELLAAPEAPDVGPAPGAGTCSARETSILAVVAGMKLRQSSRRRIEETKHIPDSFPIQSNGGHI